MEVKPGMPTHAQAKARLPRALGALTNAPLTLPPPALIQPSDPLGFPEMVLQP